MDARPRQPVATLSSAGISTSPGVYALYRDGSAVYVGKAKSLGSRLWQNHFRKGKSMTNSALRRNVAAHLGVASSADIKAGRYRPTDEDAVRVTAWIHDSEIAWMECKTEAEALLLECELKAEWKPPLTKQ